MKKSEIKNNYKFIFILIALCFYSCKKEKRWDCAKGTGKMITEIRLLDSFDTLGVYDNLIVNLHTDTINRIILTGGENLLPSVTTTVANKWLEIRNTNTCNWVRSYKKSEIVADIYCKNLVRVVHNGTGLVTGMDTIKTYYFGAAVNNSGDLKIMVNTVFTVCGTGSSGDLIISGETGVFTLWTLGTNWIRCGDLHSGYTFLNMYTSGDCFINVSKVLGVSLHSAGNAYYTGNPDEITFDKYGDGNLIKTD